MTLREVIEKLNKQGIDEVCIGSLNGTAYVFIGNTKDIDICISDYDKYYERAKENLHNVLRDIHTVFDTLNNEDDESAVRSAEIISRLYERYNRLNAYLKGYKPLMEREVTDWDFTRDKLVDSRRVIHVTGTEAGKFWFDYEWNKAHEEETK